MGSPLCRYTDPDNHIWTVKDPAALAAVTLDPSLLSWDARGGDRSGDVRMNSKFTDAATAWEMLCTIPIWVSLVWMLWTIYRRRDPSIPFRTM